MLSFLKEKEREYETPFTNTRGYMYLPQGTTIKEAPLLG